jgi:hypothetical protein
MGNNQTISIQLLNKDDLVKLIDADYTVITSFGEQTGWKIQLSPHSNEIDDSHSICEFAEQDGYATRLIPGKNNEYGFRIFMNNNSLSTVRPHECGWYACFSERREVWPTHLTTKEQKEEWWAWIDTIFSGLKSEEEEIRDRKLYPTCPDCSGCSITCFARSFDSSGNKLYYKNETSHKNN